MSAFRVRQRSGSDWGSCAMGDAASTPTKIAIVGGGVIGGGWAARWVLAGADVRVFDPAPGAEAMLSRIIDNARRALTKLYGVAPQEGSWQCVESLAEAVATAEVVHESVPERLDLKASVLASIDSLAPVAALICSSTSGLLPTHLQENMVHPERLVVAHPFNPVYLLPLVELCAGQRTAPESIERARAIFADLGMHPLVVRTEVDGFIADRLLEALWREALWLVADGVATTSEVDDAIRFGAGLRWASMGTMLTYRIAGGDGGMRHFMSQFGPALAWPWTHLTDVPELDKALLDRITEQSDAQAAGASVAELEHLRDDCVVAVIKGLSTVPFAAGSLLRKRPQGVAAPSDRGVVTPFEGSAGRSFDAASIEAPLRLHQVTVPPAWVDYNDHMSESCYLLAFGDSADAFFRYIGIDEAYRAAGHSLFSVETHIVHHGEAALGDRVDLALHVIAADAKRVHILHEMSEVGTGRLIATGEQMLLHVDTAAGQVVPLLPEPMARIEAVARAHRGIPTAVAVGRAIRPIAQKA